MATYVNNLRLTELATGEGSGTWGTTTNTNLELIGEALGYGSEAIANASTHTITVADGTADSARSFYLKLTGGGQACTVTLAPNTLSKVWMVENTTNSTLTFSQGSGANVAVPAGQVKMIATDGAGSGAVVYDLLVDTDLTGTTTVVNLTSSGTIDAATVEFDSLSGTGAVAVTDILDQDDMSSNSATALATQQSIKAYVDSSVASFDTLAEVLAQGNTTGSTDIEVTTAQKVQFRDSAIYINSSADGQLDIVADTEIQIAATTVDINGAINASGEIIAASLDISGNIDVDGTTNLDVVDIDGAVDMAAALTVAGTATFTDTVLVTRADNSTQLTLESTDADGQVGPRFDLHRNSASPAASDNLGQIRFLGDDSSGATTSYAFINSFISNPADGSESGEIVIETRVGGANRQRFTANTTETIINEDGVDLDFRVESDSNTNMLFVDGGENRVGVGTAAPDSIVHILENTNNSGTTGLSNGGLQIENVEATSGSWSQLHLKANAKDAHLRLTNAGNLIVMTESNAAALTISEAGAATFSSTIAAGAATFSTATDQAFPLTVTNTDSDSHTYIKYLDQGGQYWTTGINYASNDFVMAYGGTNLATFANAGGLSLTTADNLDTLSLISTDADANVGPNLRMYRNSGSPADSDQLGKIQYEGRNDNSQDVIYAEIGSQIKDASDGTEDGRIFINSMVAGTLQSRINILEGETVFNEESIDIDFRVESNTNTHALFVEGSGNDVGIGTSTLTSSSGYHTLSLNGSTGGQLSFQTGGSGKHFIFSSATDLNMYSAVDGALRFSTNNLERLEMTSSSTIFNDIGADTDFRVESDTQSHMLFVDASAHKVGINQSNPAATLDIVTVSTAGSDAIRLRQPSSSETYQIQMGVSGATNEGLVLRNTASTGMLQQWRANEVVINDDGADRDFRVESNGNANMLVVDGGNDAVGIGGTAVTTSSLSVTGQYEESSGDGYDYNIALVPDASLSIAQGKGTGILFQSEDTNSDFRHAANIQSFRTASSASNYSNGLRFSVRPNGAEMQEVLRLKSDEAVFNENSRDLDFRVESDTNANMLVVDAGENMVAIGGGSKVANEVLRSNGAQVVGTGDAGLYTVAINQSFAASAAKYLRIQLNSNLLGALTITATGNYSSVNAIGVFQKVYSVGVNSSNTSIYSAGNTTTIDLGGTSGQFSMGTPTKPNATTYYVPLANLNSSYTIDMSIVVEMRGYIEGITSIDIIAA